MSTSTRRQILIGSAAALAAPWTIAQSGWPTKPVTVVVPFPPGGGTDAFARPLFAAMARNTGKQFLIDNKGGAGGTLGAGVASRAAADGYNFFMGAVHHTIAPSMYPKLDYNIETDFIPVGLVSSVPQVIVVNPTKVAATTLPQLLEFLRRNSISCGRVVAVTLLGLTTMTCGTLDTRPTGMKSVSML